MPAELRKSSLNRPLLFLHIPKTSGTSFLLMLKNAFGDNNVLRILQVDDSAKIEIASVADGSSSIACLTGHLPVKLFDGRLDRFQPFTILREPISRVLSLFRFTKTRDTKWTEQLGLRAGFSLNEFLESKHPELHGQTNNDMVRMLTGDKRFVDPECHDFWTAEGALSALPSAMAQLERIDFGIMEEMANTLEIARKSWCVPYKLREYYENATAASGIDADLTAIHKIIQNNAVDLVLYHAARSVFRRKVAAISDITTGTSTWRAQAIFDPPLNEVVLIGDIAGRQGFHEVEPETGFAWLCAGMEASINFVASPREVRLKLHVYCIVPDYPLAALLISINGRRLKHDFSFIDNGRWCWITTEAFVMTADINELGITCPLFMQAKDLDPNALDDRQLAIALSDLTVLS